MRAEKLAAWLVSLSLVSAATQAQDEAPPGVSPGDDFLEFLGAWDEAWAEACEPDGYLPGDAACEQNDDQDNDDRDDEN